MEAMLTWLKEHGYAHWGKCSPEGVLADLALNGEFAASLTDAEDLEITALAMAAL